jgi:hypothetical protein
MLYFPVSSLLWLRNIWIEETWKEEKKIERWNRNEVRIEKKFVRICSQRTGKESSVSRRDFIRYLIDLSADWQYRHPLQSTCHQIIRSQQNKSVLFPIALILR